MTAVAIHQLAVNLYELKESFHEEDYLDSWERPGATSFDRIYYSERPPVTLFQHQWYLDFEQYPHGVGDVIGYWAEARIFGGVVLFDRNPKTEVDTLPCT